MEAYEILLAGVLLYFIAISSAGAAAAWQVIPTNASHTNAIDVARLVQGVDINSIFIQGDW